MHPIAGRLASLSKSWPLEKARTSKPSLSIMFLRVPNSEVVASHQRLPSKAASSSPRTSHTSGSANAVTLAAVGVADSELVVGIGVEANVGVHPHAHAT